MVLTYVNPLFRWIYFSRIILQVKTQALVKGNLVVAKSLPEHLQQGIFKTPGASYPIVARFANEPSHIQPDTVNGPRGVGIKVFNVTGEFLEGAEGHSQDLFFNNAQPLELRFVYFL